MGLVLDSSPPPTYPRYPTPPYDLGLSSSSPSSHLEAATTCAIVAQDRKRGREEAGFPATSSFAPEALSSEAAKLPRLDSEQQLSTPPPSQLRLALTAPPLNAKGDHGEKEEGEAGVDQDRDRDRARQAEDAEDGEDDNLSTTSSSDPAANTTAPGKGEWRATAETRDCQETFLRKRSF